MRWSWEKNNNIIFFGMPHYIVLVIILLPNLLLNLSATAANLIVPVVHVCVRSYSIPVLF